MRQLSLFIFAATLAVSHLTSGVTQAQQAGPNRIPEPIQEPIQEPIIEPVNRPRERMFLKNFSYFDHITESMVPATSMLIEDGIITALDTPEAECAGCDVIDLEGGFLIPGLMDLHQHLNTGGFAKTTEAQKTALFRRNLYWGITTVYNPNIKLPLLRSLRASIEKNPRNFPELFAAGQNIGIEGGWGDVSVNDFNSLKIAATKQLEASADNIKLSIDDMSWLSTKPMAQFPDLLLRQAVALMHNNNRRVFAHVSQAKDVETAINAGVDVLIHGTIDEPLPEPIANQISGRNIGYISTLTLYETIADVKKTVRDTQRFDPDLVMGRNLYENMSSELMAQNWMDWWDESHLLKAKLPIVRGNTVALVKAGALVGVGTDAGTPSVIFGASLPFEMHMHEQIGLHPLKVLKLATYNNARIMQIANRTGTIQAGMEADLVFMRENPADGIKAINSAEWTMQNGMITYRQELLER